MATVTKYPKLVILRNKCLLPLCSGGYKYWPRVIKSCLFSEDMVYKWSECPSLFALIITMNTLQPKPDARLC